MGGSCFIRLKIRNFKIIFIALFISLILIYPKECVQAGVWDNAYDYYRTYGNSVVFCPKSQEDGDICFATEAWLNSTAYYRYRTLGWRVSVRNRSGGLIQTIYLQLNAGYLRLDNRVRKNGYEYDLYKISLTTLKFRMNANSLAALNSGNCMITLDACNVILKNGVPQGGMNDTGITWGTVYCDYNSIINALSWSSSTQSALRGFYNKQVTGLFYTVTLGKGSGIASVSGQGTYCYGTRVKINAVPQKGYFFGYWKGTNTNSSQTYSFYLNGNCSWTAYGTVESTTVIFHRNYSEEDIETSQQTFIYGSSNRKITNKNWQKEGYECIGWSNSSKSTVAEYEKEEMLSNEWIHSNYPMKHLYGVWKEKTYTIHFDANGAEGEMDDLLIPYTHSLGFPDCAFSSSSSTFLGWSTDPLALNPTYLPQDEKSLVELISTIGIMNVVQDTINVYAIWDQSPAIEANNLYFSLEAARQGIITESALVKYAKAVDREDGEISYGRNEHNSFLITNYTREDFVERTEAGSVVICYRAKDSLGNICEKEITVYLVDMTPEIKETGKQNLRFIAKGQYDGTKKGGLPLDSPWNVKAPYREALKKTFLR